MRRNNNLQRNTTAWKPDEDNSTSYKCCECGENFPKPLLATVSSSGQSQMYYACPRCLTKVDVATHQRQEQRQEERTEYRAEPTRTGPPTEKTVGCGHFFGYLKKRPKDMPVPDDCLTCDKMVECLIR